MEQVTVEERKRLLVDGFVKTGHHNPHILIAIPLKGKLDWAIIFMSYFDDWSMKLMGFHIDWEKKF